MFMKLLLDGKWELSCKNRKISKIAMNIPGDVHSALLENKIIKDPFFDRNEKDVEWVHNETWKIKRDFEVSGVSKYQAINLILEDVDTYATFWINSHKVLETTNMFRIYTVDVKKYLSNGRNTIKVEFYSAVKKAEELNKTLPNDVPWSEGNNQVPHMNLVRKPQFQSGWDWGPCIIPIGIYESVKLEFVNEIFIKGVKIEKQRISKENADITFNVYADNYAKDQLTDDLVVSFAGKTQTTRKIEKGVFQCSFSIDAPKLWYTWDLGDQFLYDIDVFYGKEKIFTKKIGLRDIKLVTEKDEYGTSFKFVLNGIDVFCRGSNLIPLDSLPERETKERTRKMLEDAKEANMNMIRVWGGGYFLRDFFYEACDEFGLLVWQDLMFACAQYPTTEWFFNEVSKELADQTLRLQSHPSIALWAGDNEVWNTINWSTGTKDNKEFYRSEYGKLNQFLKKLINELDQTRVFWLASPSIGEPDYQGNFIDKKYSIGDSHFWEVWHGKLNFSGFLNINPRFCSEFGFQSYPSYPCVQTFTPKGTNSLEHPAFDAHQKNKKGNAKIADMFTQYFKAPTDFQYTLYLSQVQQAIAIKTAVEHWRQIKNKICSGALFWQLNDVWPVSSWSSVEYGGRWKQLMYHAKHFFEPQTISFEDGQNQYKLHFINDLPQKVSVRYRVRWFNWNGEMVYGHTGNAEVEPLKEQVIWEGNKWQVPLPKEKGFIYATAVFNDNTVSNFLFTDVYKNCDIPHASISTSIEKKEGKSYITLETDKPAFFVHLEHKDVLKFSDSSFVLLPGTKKVVTCDSEIDSRDLSVFFLK